MINYDMLKLIYNYVKEWGDEPKFRYVKDYLKDKDITRLCQACELELNNENDRPCNSCKNDYAKIKTFIEACKWVGWELEHLNDKLNKKFN